MTNAQQAALYGHLSFSEATALRASIEAELTVLGKPLQDAPKGPNGATLPSAQTAAWRSAHTAYHAKREVARWLTAWYVRTFKKELQAERRAIIASRTRG